VIDLLEPSAAEPPISQMAPALRPRPRPSSARLTRVSEDEVIAESVASSSSSSRR
jgi:hypothetical protein